MHLIAGAGAGVTRTCSAATHPLGDRVSHGKALAFCSIRAAALSTSQHPFLPTEWRAEFLDLMCPILHMESRSECRLIAPTSTRGSQPYAGCSATIRKSIGVIACIVHLDRLRASLRSLSDASCETVDPRTTSRVGSA